MNHSGANRRLADQFAEVRAERKRLKVIEDEMRRELIDDPDSRRHGEEWCVTVCEVVSERLDLDAIREFLSPDQRAAFTIRKATTYVRAVPREVVDYG